MKLFNPALLSEALLAQFIQQMTNRPRRTRTTSRGQSPMRAPSPPMAPVKPRRDDLVTVPRSMVGAGMSFHWDSKSRIKKADD
jgi:hypothetical protein